MNPACRYFKICAIFMVLLILGSPVIGVCHDDERHLRAAGTTTVSHAHGQQDAPCCPDSGQHDPGYDSCSSCPCHAPLLPAGLDLAVVRIVSDTSFAEPSGSTPEVYLTLFDPPDVSA